MTNPKLREELMDKINVLFETSWEEYRIMRPDVNRWLNNFKDDSEKLNALYLLSQFIYFGSREMRNLLKCLYRDLYKYPKVAEIRKKNSDTIDALLIEQKFSEQLSTTRFIGMGNPSESGCHLLYFFRQENKLSKKLFIHAHEIFKRYSGNTLVELVDSSIDQYVFIDDFCGTGSQSFGYTETLIQDLRVLNPGVKVDYLMLFGTKDGIDFLINKGLFDRVSAVFELEESFKCFSDRSRYYRKTEQGIDKAFTRTMCSDYGARLMKTIFLQEGIIDPDLTIFANANSLGFGDCQLLIGFHHNTPDNTLPIIWYDENEVPWEPIFKRYNKKYGL